MESLFIAGLMNEEEESLASQLGLWHHLTLRNILQRKLTGWFRNRDDLGSFLQNHFNSAAQLDTVELKGWKLNEAMLFFKIAPPKRLDIYELNSIGVEIETQAVALLRRIDREFKGRSTDEMVSHLLETIIRNFSDEFKKKDISSQKEIVQKIIDIIHSMSMEQQDVLKELLSIEELSPDLIRQAIFNHTLSTALASFATMVKYTIYYEVAKIALALSGALSFYIAKPYLKPLIPLVLFFFSPIAVASIGIGLIWWTDLYTNREIQSFLLPVMVMSSILCSAQIDPTSLGQESKQFIDFYNLNYLHTPNINGKK